MFAGRLQALKGADLAIATLVERVRRGGDDRLVVVGGPSGQGGDDYADSHHDLASASGVADRVRFVAPQPHELLSTYYRAADVCLVPSRAETFGLVALEAGACGTPVVATDVGGLAALVEDRVTGRLVKERRAGAWADAVEWATEDPLRATRASTAAVLRARRFTWRAAATRLDDVVRAVGATHLVSCA